jgi:hypothetical protein
VDPVATLRQALSLPADSAEQAAVLSSLRETLESVPANVPALLLKTLVPSVHQQGDTLFKQWVFELLWNIVCRAPMSLSERTGCEFANHGLVSSRLLVAFLLMLVYNHYLRAEFIIFFPHSRPRLH